MTDSKYYVKSKDGKVSLLETDYIDFARPIGKDTGENIVYCKYVGGHKTFSFKEEELHKHIIGWLR